MKINHLGIATKSIDDALKFWGGALGLENEHTEIVEDQKVKVAMLPLGESRIELLEPTSTDSPISKFLEKRGGGRKFSRADEEAAGSLVSSVGTSLGAMILSGPLPLRERPHFRREWGFG